MDQQKVRCSFDLPVGRTEAPFMKMSSLMECSRVCIQRKEWATARKILEFAVESNHIPAKLALARLLIQTPELAAGSSGERYARAEGLYREVLAAMELPDEIAARAALELSRLYSDWMARPVGALAMLLKARRRGAQVEAQEIDQATRRIARMDVNSFGGNRRDAYELGMELLRTGTSLRTAELFLREAAGAEDPAVAGSAWLALSDLYRQNASEYPRHMQEAARCLAAAEKAGCPEYMSQEVWKQQAPGRTGRRNR